MKFIRELRKVLRLYVNIFDNGTEHTVAKSLGIPLEEAKEIVDNYSKLHWKIKKFQQDITVQATKDGFIVLPHGLKLRCKALQSSDESVAQKTMRSVTNAVSQGQAGVINTISAYRLQDRIEQAGYDNDIILFNQIHDAIYALVRAEPHIIKWYNDNLIECMLMDYVENQEIPLAANLGISHSWDKETELPNNCSTEYIADVLKTLE